MIEKGILETEASNIDLTLESSSAHMISYTKLGEYGTGEVKILRYYTPEGLKQVNDNKDYRAQDTTNTIINYTC